MAFPKTLPVDNVLPDVIAALTQHKAAVLQAPTGSGKTTRVSPAILKAGLLNDGLLVLLQPRRVAARACARAMATMLGEKVGGTIGYQIRFERKMSKETKILVVTEGILTRRFADDPMLEDISCIVLDEFHERSLHTDLTLAFLKELRELRDDLHLLVMSATIDADPVSSFLDDCPCIHAEGRSFPLDISYLPTSPADPLEERVEDGLRQLLEDPNDDGGHILVFLPGVGEIRRTEQHLQKRDWGAEVVPLHGSLSSQQQDYALQPSQKRRIILATNIAETSLTIEGVTAVVDTGLHKMLMHDNSRGTDRLDRVRISQAGATQRAGRAGRTAPGRVVRLWSQDTHAIMPKADPPEIQRADLTNLLLAVLNFHGHDLGAFPFFQRPPEMAMDRALQVLDLIGARDEEGRLTPLGQKLCTLPLHPRLGAIMESAANQGRLPQAATLCAILGERAPRNLADAHAQYLAFVNDERAWDPRTSSRLRDTQRQLREQARRLWPQSQNQQSNLLTAPEAAQLALAGYADRLCVGRGPGQGVMLGGRGISYELPNGAKGHDYFLALELVERGKDRTTGKADRILPLSLQQIQEHLPVEETQGAIFDPQSQSVRGVTQLRLRDLVLKEKPSQNVAPHILAQRLAEEALKQWERIFKLDRDAQHFLMRLRFAAKHMPDQDWPDVSESGLQDMLPTLCTGLRKFDELRRLDWTSQLRNAMPYQLQQLLDKEVPERLKVPSGTNIRIDYEPAFTDTGFPVLAVRLQEMFGMTETPRIAKGRVPLLCHLLAPNMRPAQVTQDLHNFWANTYAEVRKELRQRYPKHSWPEDPWTAQAIRGVVRKKRN